MWGECNRPMRGGFTRWQPFEGAPWEQQANLLTGTAQAVAALTSGDMAGGARPLTSFFRNRNAP
jgi:hypothetical protein